MPSFWVNSAACVDVERNKITHKLAHGELVETQPWLRAGPLTIGARFPGTTRCLHNATQPPTSAARARPRVPSLLQRACER